MQTTYSFDYVMSKAQNTQTKSGPITIRTLKAGSNFMVCVNNIPTASLSYVGRKVKLEMLTRDRTKIKIIRVVGEFFENHGFEVNLKIR